ncbi:MAG TPA: 2-oxoacid:acceptor oxidoreductase family protein, partial [Gaiellaceae bacterium]|nr:2-oxoacid:acceptor oxidoreductase family protein [Gaiellaceae bacterium]
DVDAGRHAPSDPTDVLIDGQPWVHHPLHTIGPHQIPNQEVLVVEHRLRAAQAYARHNGLDRVVGAEPGAVLGVVCAGKTYFDVVQALADLGHPVDELEAAGVRILKLAMTYPVVPETIRDFAASVDSLVVIEEKRPFVETQLRGILHEAAIRTPVLGKRDRDGAMLAAQVGELDSTMVREILVRVAPTLAPLIDAPVAHTRLPLLQLPGRAPAFCSGCPHNRSTVIPEGALVGGGVGCHGIMYFEARHRGMKSMPPTPMGAEGVPWIGLSPFVAEPHLIQNIGDGTLSHSGTLAIRACVAANADITFKVLYNAAVAMTGGQDVTGIMDVPALTRALAAEGVGRIVVCAEDPKHYGRHADWADGVRVLARDELPAVQEELRDVRGVTVIVYDQRCAAESRRLRKAGALYEPPQRVVINEAVCEGCGDCSTKSNCLSVLPLETEFGEKRRIHDSSCNRDYTCLEGECPSFVTVTPKDPDAARTPTSPTATHTERVSLPAGTLPEPAVRAVDGQFGVYFTGIGGTGVVTAIRIVATAGEDAGFLVGGMDQTGLSQKAGAVVSHLHLATDRDALGAAAVGSGGADLYLSGDILQAASANHLARIRGGTTIAVIDRDVTPTAAMLQTDTAPPELALLEQTIADRVGPDRTVFVDAQAIAEGLLGNHVLANVVLLGAAYQAGGLPVGLAGIE